MPYEPACLDGAAHAVVALHVLRFTRTQQHRQPPIVIRVGTAFFVTNRLLLTTWSMVKRQTNFLLISPDGTKRSATLVAASRKNNLALLRLKNGQRGATRVLSLATRFPKLCTPVQVFGCMQNQSADFVAEAEDIFCSARGAMLATCISCLDDSQHTFTKRGVLRMHARVKDSWEGGPIVSRITGEVLSLITEGIWLDYDLLGNESCVLCGGVLGEMHKMIRRGNNSH